MFEAGFWSEVAMTIFLAIKGVLLKIVFVNETSTRDEDSCNEISISCNRHISEVILQAVVISEKFTSLHYRVMSVSEVVVHF